jgi:hypothetical protein
MNFKNNGWFTWPKKKHWVRLVRIFYIYILKPLEPASYFRICNAWSNKKQQHFSAVTQWRLSRTVHGAMAHLTGLAASHPELRMLVLSLCRFVWIWEVWVINSYKFCNRKMPILFSIHVLDFCLKAGRLRCSLFCTQETGHVKPLKLENQTRSRRRTWCSQPFSHRGWSSLWVPGYGSKLTPIIGWLRHVKTQNGLKPTQTHNYRPGRSAPHWLLRCCLTFYQRREKTMAAWKLISEQVPNGFVMSAPQK